MKELRDTGVQKGGFRPAALLFAALAVVVYGIFLYESVIEDSPVMDEVEYIGSGYFMNETGKYVMNVVHPPLEKILFGAAIANDIRAKPSPASLTTSRSPLGAQYGFQLLYLVGNDPDSIVMHARTSAIVLNCLLLFLSTALILNLFGYTSAILAFCAIALEPNMIAHGRYSTLDAASSYSILAALLTAALFVRSKSRLAFLSLVLAVSLALLIRYSAILVVPAILMLLFLQSDTHGRKTISSNVSTCIFLLVAVGIVVGAGMEISYWSLSAVETARSRLVDSSMFPSFSTYFVSWLLEFPIGRGLGYYLVGLLTVTERVFEYSRKLNFLHGDVYSGGRWSYFPVLFLLKAPLFHLLFYICGLSAFINGIAKREVKHKAMSITLLVVTAIFFAATFRTNFNIGVRYVLPVVPVLSLFAALQFPIFCRRILLCAIPVLFAIPVISTYPHYLSFYNRLAGGIENGHAWGVDSNYDWGQDLKRLRKVLDELPPRPLYIDYFGIGNPDYYLGRPALRWRVLSGKPPGDAYFVISATSLQKRGPARGVEGSKWLAPLKPIARAGMTLFVYQTVSDN